WEYGVTFAFSAFIIALMLTFENFNYVAMLLGAILGSLPVAVSMGLDKTWGLWISIIGLFIVWLLNSKDNKTIGEFMTNAKYFTLVPMMVWLLWSLTTISTRVGDLVFPWQYWLFHLALLCFAGWAAFRFLGLTRDANSKPKRERVAKIAFGLVLTTGFGMLLAIPIAGWSFV
ncbi:MAG: hypothetical protein OEY81_00645, partial [Candidatus Bathyarchaeota archaeon]|nr:hypothetical protein [Candidatus Bathyarchaeota archaeon]